MSLNGYRADLLLLPLPLMRLLLLPLLLLRVLLLLLLSRFDLHVLLLPVCVDQMYGCSRLRLTRDPSP